MYVVTTLADSGPRSFREACEAAGPRTIVFNVAGIIKLLTPLHVRAPYLTIAGQTAPGDGVCIAGNVTSIDTHDVVIRYMRFRRGENNVERREHSLTGHVVGNIIVDHCSTSWSMEENLSMYRHMFSSPSGGKDLKLPVVNITIQWTISSEGLNPNEHAFGGTWGGRNTSFHHNLFANNTGRNPSIGMGYDFNFINNVLFNWRHRTVDGGDKTSLVNCINNYYRPGPATPDAPIRYCVLRPNPSWTKADPVARYGRVYVAGNVVEHNEAISADNWAGGVQFKATPGEGAKAVTDSAQVATLINTVRSTKPFPMAPVTIQTAQDALVAVIEDAGATLPQRDLVDRRIIREVQTGEPSYRAGNGIISDIAQVGGYPPYEGSPFADMGSDGIPLWWKKKFGLDASDTGLAVRDLQGDGYTVIEKYLNGLDPTRKIDWANPRSNVNTLRLSDLRAGSAIQTHNS